MGAIAIFTESGNTARMISKFRPRVSIYAFSHTGPVCNRLNLFWGVHPVQRRELSRTAEDMVNTAERELLHRGQLKPGDVLAHMLETVRRALPLTRRRRCLHHARPCGRRHVASRLGVMYAGRLVEHGPRDELFRTAAHPYTRRLLEAVPDISGRFPCSASPGARRCPGSDRRLLFAPRCEYAVEPCRQAFPPIERGGGLSRGALLPQPAG